MAFTPETFVVCSKFPLFRASCNLWLYVTSDTLDTCLTENYFQPRMNTKNQDSPEVGDIIQCIVAGGTIAYLVITAKTEKPYNITVERTYLENEAAIYDAIYAAADKGEQLYQTGVWYAKMYSDTVVPTGSEYEDRNYADFSQVDSDNNPIIVIYECQSGVWVEIQRITPPTEYNGYLPITSKFWDIEEQTGQQGGEVLWSFNTKRFTPFPRIISYDSIHITGDSTVEIPDDPSSTQIVNKDYVDTAISLIPIPTVDIPQSVDAEIIGALTQDGAVFSGFSATKYLRISGLLDLSKPFELVFGAKFDNTTDYTQTLLMADGGTIFFEYSPIGTLTISFYTDASKTTSGSVAANTDYLIKFSWDGADYKLLGSTDDGETYTQIGSTISSSVAITNTHVSLGKTFTSSDFAGTIDLTKAYFKSGDNIFWRGLDASGLHQRVATGHEVIEFQAPTAQNNYTWYRKYADGWVEIGGTETINPTSAATINLPVTMADTNYQIYFGNATSADSYNASTKFFNKTTTSFQIENTEGAYANTTCWEVKGIMA